LSELIKQLSEQTSRFAHQEVEPAGLRDWRTLSGHHYDEHDPTCSPTAPRARHARPRPAPSSSGLAPSSYSVSAGSGDANNVTIVRPRAMHLRRCSTTSNPFLGLTVKPQRGQFK